MGPRAPPASDINHSVPHSHAIPQQQQQQQKERVAATESDQGEQDGVDLSLCRKLRLCAALLANDIGLVFMQLYMIPLLQALGVPVSMETVSLTISGTLALTTLPMMGRFSDGGSNPRGRKRPAVVVASSVYVLGSLLLVGACLLHLWGDVSLAQDTPQPFSAKGGSFVSTASHNASLSASLSPVPPGLGTTGPYRGSLFSSPVPPYKDNDNNPARATATPNKTKNSSTTGKLASLLLPDSGYQEEYYTTTGTSNALSANNIDTKNPKGAMSADSKPEPYTVETTSRESEISEQRSRASPSEEASSSQARGWVADPLGVGIPLQGLLALAGFAFVDLGYDLTNSCVKTFVLAATPRVHHVMLLILGVLMSAVGGCITALTGLIDVGPLITRGTSLDPVVAQALLQSSLMVVAAVLCTLCTLSAASAATAPVSDNHTLTIPTSNPDSDVEQSQSQPIIASFGTLHTDIQENVIMATTSPLDVFSGTPTNQANLDTGVFHFPESAGDVEDVVAAQTQASSAAEGSVHCNAAALDSEGEKHLLTYLSTAQPDELTGGYTEDPEEKDNDFMVTSFMDTEFLLDKNVKRKKGRKQRQASNVGDDEDSTSSSSPTFDACRLVDSVTSRLTGNQSVCARTDTACRNAVQKLANIDTQPKSSGNNHERENTDERKRLLGKERRGCCPESAICFSKRLPGVPCCGRLEQTRSNLVLICLFTFFMAGSTQSFNTSATDYLGKVIFCGDPKADPDSQSYDAYQEGLRAGSLGMLLLNAAYILFNLLHRHILGFCEMKSFLLVGGRLSSK